MKLTEAQLRLLAELADDDNCGVSATYPPAIALVTGGLATWRSGKYSDTLHITPLVGEGWPVAGLTETLGKAQAPKGFAARPPASSRKRVQNKAGTCQMDWRTADTRVFASRSWRQ